jgi:hypothetical protein
MSEIQTPKSTRSMTFSSSVKDDVWHDQTEAGAFQSWHFDALSDDGREAVSIEFSDNYHLSSLRQKSNGGAHRDGKPAVSFVYSVDGKAVARVLSEFNQADFAANDDVTSCKIGGSSFEVASAEYGSGFIVRVDLPTRRGRRITAELEWLDVETGGDKAEGWNIIAPRSDVSGRITVVGRSGDVRRRVNFRGTGYHDQFSLDDSHRTANRCWGRAHFVDATAIFQHVDGEVSSSKLYLSRDGELHERDAEVEMQNIARDRFGMKIPQRLTFTSADNIRIRIKPVRAIRSGFFEKKVVSEITLSLRDGKPRKTLGITEFWAPSRLNRPLIRLLSSLMSGRAAN